jgi:hypothetical protein
MWQGMDVTAQCAVVVLLVMAAISAYVTINRIWRYNLARHQARHFVLQAAGVFSTGKLDDVIVLAASSTFTKPTRPWTSPNGPAASLLSREDLEILQFGMVRNPTDGRKDVAIG